MSLYDLTLWKYFSVTVFNKFRSYYNKCIKKLFAMLDVTVCLLLS